MTDVNVPAGWKKVHLAKVAQIQTGLAKGKSNIKNPVSFPYLRVANVQDGRLDLTEIKLIDVSASEVTRYLLKPGDVLLTEGGDNDKLGRGTIWRGEIQNCLHQNHIFVVRPDKNILDPRFLSLLTNSPYGKLYFRKSAKQTTNLASINTKQLSAFPVLLPPISEQKLIINMFTKWDEAIAKTEQLIAALRRRKQGLMQRLLTGQVRFPGFEGEWKEVCLSKICSKRKGKIVRINPCHKGFPYIGSTSFTGKFTVFSDDPSGVRCFPTDILILWDGEYAGKTATGLDGYASSTVVILRPDLTCANNFFVNYFLELHNANIRRIAEGSGIPHMPGDLLEWLKIGLPPLPEQNMIAEVITISNNEIDLQRKKLDALKQQKKGLMQRLLTGQVRVKV